MAENQTPALLPAMSADQLKQIVDSAVTAAVSAAVGSGQGIAAAIAEGMAANAPKRKVTIGQYDPRTWVQPDKGKALKLTRACFQNGTLVDADVCSNGEIEPLNQITRSGRYLNGQVEVIVRQDGADETVWVKWDCKSRDTRALVESQLTADRTDKDKSGWADCLRRVVAEQQAQDAEMDAAPRAKRAALFGGPGDLAGLRAAKAHKVETVQPA